MTQSERVLARLRLGPVSPVDFQLPDVCDGWKPILRVAARVLDLQSQGCVIRSERAANGTAIYHLVSEPERASRDAMETRGFDSRPVVGLRAAGRPSMPAESPGLFDSTVFADRGDYKDVA